MPKSKKQRFDLWILSSKSIRLVECCKSAKKCRRIASETELNETERFIMTPISKQAYCPLLSCNQAVRSEPSRQTLEV